MKVRSVAFGGLLIVDFLLVVVMLFTDKNLQSDFGAMTVPPYYLHWYGALAMGVLDLVGGVIVLGLGASSTRSESRMAKFLTTGALAWTVLAIIASVAIVETWQQVGFANAMQFAQYLFGLNAYPDSLSYIPGLYDALIVAYLLTAVAGLLAVWQLRRADPKPAPSTGTS